MNASAADAHRGSAVEKAVDCCHETHRIQDSCWRARGHAYPSKAIRKGRMPWMGHIHELAYSIHGARSSLVVTPPVAA